MSGFTVNEPGYSLPLQADDGSGDDSSEGQPRYGFLMDRITALAAVALAIGADVDKAWDIAERVASRLEGREAYQAVVDEIVAAKYAVIA